MKKRFIAFALLCIAALCSVWVQSTYFIPENLIITSRSNIAGMSYPEACHSTNETDGVINQPDGFLQVLVWNIYKQNTAGSLAQLSELSQTRQLTLLQEAKVDTSFWTDYPFREDWRFFHVDAWEYDQQKNGVLTAASVSPSEVCGFRLAEPWLILPKSALLTYYLLSNGERLVVANIHAVNFSLGLDAYRKQIKQLTDKLRTHSGPIIFAGDFNSWSGTRIEFLNTLKTTLNLQEVTYKHDEQRKRFVTGYPLDHIFYRGLKQISANVIATDKSDHNALVATFKITEPQS